MELAEQGMIDKKVTFYMHKFCSLLGLFTYGQKLETWAEKALSN